MLGAHADDARTSPSHDLFAPAVADLAALGHPRVDHRAPHRLHDERPDRGAFAIADDLAGRRSPRPTILTETRTPAVDDGGAEAGAESTFMQNVDDPYGEPGVYDVYPGWYGPAPNYQQGVAPVHERGR